jgi:hypothetical protein
MANCPNCGEIVMNGDPYCSHCGTHLKWEREGDLHERPSSESLDDILNSMHISETQKSLLKIKLNSMLEARDVTGLEVGGDYREYIFSFTRKNEYVTTVDRFFYDPKDQNLMRVFYDCESNHSHDGLLNSPRFKRMVEKTGLEFIECRGGHKVEYEFYPMRFDFSDEIDILVYFALSGNRERVCHLDLEKMELIKCHDYDV